MIARFAVLLAAASLFWSGSHAAAASDARCFELRIYHAAPGKLDDLHERFRNHTIRLFERHGIQSVGYWVPVQNQENPRLFFILSYPDRAAREASWKAFMADPEWQKVHRESEANGTLVTKVENFFLGCTDYSPAIGPSVSPEPRVFELRDYTASAGNLGRLNARFRDHTVRLFEKHGMRNIAYWTPLEGEPGSEDRLIYLISHRSTDAARRSFAAFGQDPEWREARAASERDAGGSLTAPGGVKSTFLVATDYSPIR